MLGKSRGIKDMEHKSSHLRLASMAANYSFAEGD